MRTIPREIYLLFITIFLIISDGFGQEKFVKGYIVTNKGEKVCGLIQEETEIKKYTSCVFKLSDTGEPTLYGPDEISSYKCANDQYYISKTIKIGEESKKLFLKYLLDGSVVDILSFSDNSGIHYFAQKDKKLIELCSNLDVGSLNKENYLKKNKEYQEKLKVVLKEFPEFHKEIENTAFSKDFLVRITDKYNYKYLKKYKKDTPFYKDSALKKAVEVMKQVEPLLEINPDSAYCLIEKGKEMAYSGKYAKLQVRYVELEGMYFKTIGDYVKAHKKYIEALESFKALSFKTGIASSLDNLGQLYLIMGETQKAEEYFNNSLKVLDSFSNSLSMYNKAILNANVGNLFKDKGDLAKALDYQLKAMVIFERMDSTIDLSNVFANIGDVYFAQKNYKNALKYYWKSAEIREIEKRINTLMDSWIGIAACYTAMNKYNRAKEMLQKVIDYKSQYNQKLSIGTSYLELGRIELKEKKLSISKQYFTKAFDIFNEINAGIKIAQVYKEIALVLQRQKEYSEAIKHLNKCYEKSSKLGSQILALEALELQTEVYKELNNYRKVFEIQEQKFKLQTKYSNEVQKKEIALIEAKHYIAQNELKIDNLEQTNNSQALEIENKRYQVALLLTCIIVILLIGVMVYLKLKSKQSKKEQKLINQKLDIENKLLRIQFDPHFIFNGLNSVQAYISENNIKNAAIFLSEFSKLMRLILNSTRNELICLSDEIELLNLYLNLERHRHNYSFEYFINICDDIDETCIKVPSFMTQPFIENALIHGFPKANIDKKLTISFTLKDKEENIIKCEITDNGNGYNKTIKDSVRHKGIGTKLTKERLDLYQNKFKQELSIKVENLDENNTNCPGTKVLMDIPYFLTT